MAAYLNRQSPDRRGGCHRSDLQPARRCMRQKAGFRLIFWAIAPIFRSFADGVESRVNRIYFGSIPHTDLLKSVARRIVDRRVLHLIKMWLDCPVEEIDQQGRKKRTTEARDNRRGIPQGSPLSPLLANLYMRRFVLGWKKLGLEQSLGTRLVGQGLLHGTGLWP